MHSGVMSICSGCRNKIEEEEKIDCSKCGGTYDLLCANITLMTFTTLTSEAILTWLCQGCRSKLPRGDNSDTPVRQVPRNAHPGTTSVPAIDLPIASENVTTFRGGARRGRQTSDHAPADSIRAIIREELEIMVDKRLPGVLSQLLDNYFTNNKFLQKLNELTARITTMDKKLDSLSKAMTPMIACQAQAPSIKKLTSSTAQNRVKPNVDAQASSMHSRAESAEIVLAPPNEIALATVIATKVTQQTGLQSLSPDKISEGPIVQQFDTTRRPQPSNSLGVPTTTAIKDDTVEDGWTEVRRRRTRASFSSVLRGTAAPGTTKLEASERWRYLHLYYVKQGTSDSQVREHLLNICGGDVCTVDVLKARGNYASFKLAVPSRLAEIVMSAQNWAEDICVKPWRRNFRAKNDESTQL